VLWGAALVVAGVALVWPSWPALQVAVTGGDTYLLPLARGERFGLRFHHSVDGLPVEDWYRLSRTAIVQEETRLLSFGAGMGHVAGVSREQGPWLHIEGIGRTIEVLHLRVGPASVGHVLRYRQARWPLSECWPGRRVTLRGVRVSLVAHLTLPAAARTRPCGGA
jgi:hypothetical protein